MAVVRPSARPSGPPDPPEQPRHRLVPVPLSHRQAPLRVEAEAGPLEPSQALRPLSPQGFRPQEGAPPPLLPEPPPIPARVPEPPPARPPAPSPPPLSPELALVSPDLAEEARAELPEVSWDEPPKRPRPPAADPPRVEPARPARRPPPPARERRYVPGERSGSRSRSRPRPELPRPRIRTSTFVLLALAAFVAVTGVLPARDAPTVITPTQKAKAGKPKTARPTPPPLVAGAVYAEGDRLRLRVGAKGRRLSGTTGAVPCAPQGVAFRAGVARDGSFRGTVRGRRVAATGTVLGRFGPRTTVSGIIRVRRPACDSGPVLFVAGIPRR